MYIYIYMQVYAQICIYIHTRLHLAIFPLVLQIPAFVFEDYPGVVNNNDNDYIKNAINILHTESTKRV
jgi:phage terminase Nu1 subunit (DNA packaging protein)